MRWKAETAQRFIDDTIDKIFAVRERLANEIMKELGIEHSPEE